MNELQITDDLIDILMKQKQYFTDNIGNPEKLMKTIGTLESKHNRPHLLYLARKLENTYDSESSELVSKIENKVNEYVRSEVSHLFQVKFKNFRDLTFSIFEGENELVRFSLMNKEYAYMNYVITEDNYYNKIKANENNIRFYNEELLNNMVKVEKYVGYQNNYFKLLKEIKNVKDIGRFIFKGKVIKKGIADTVGKYQEKTKFYEEEISRLKENGEFLFDRFNTCKSVIASLDGFFDSLEYTQAERSWFYF